MKTGAWIRSLCEGLRMLSFPTIKRFVPKRGHSAFVFWKFPIFKFKNKGSCFRNRNDRVIFPFVSAAVVRSVNREYAGFADGPVEKKLRSLEIPVRFCERRAVFSGSIPSSLCSRRSGTGKGLRAEICRLWIKRYLCSLKRSYLPLPGWRNW